MRHIPDNRGNPVLEAEVAVEPEVHAVRTKGREGPQPDHVGVSATWGGKTPCEAEAGVGQEGETEGVAATQALDFVEGAGGCGCRGKELKGGDGDC